MTDTYACGITMHRPLGDLYDILNIDDKLPTDAIRGLFEDEELTDDQRYAWKALSDPFYSVVYRCERNTKALYDAGFFDDGLPQMASTYKAWSAKNMTTSIQKVIDNIEKLIAAGGTRAAVLLTTGGMAPIHNGHIAMMEVAREQIERKNNLTVVGGFFAPGHDSYVGQKYNGTAAIPAAHRVAMVELATRDSDWLEVDPWAARYMPAELNFTDVYSRLAMYLLAHLKSVARGLRYIDLYYVCGSDNAGFVNAIARSIVVDRTEVSSKAAREGDHAILHPKVAEYLKNYKSTDTGNLPYLIRNEEDDAISGYANTMPGGMAELTRRRIQLQSTIRLGIAQVFKSLGHEHKVHLLSTSDQRTRALEVIAGRKTISLDPFFSGDERIDSTRYFSLSQAQFKPLFRAARVGHLTIRDQASLIDPGEYVLVEDDSVTGETINSARANLSEDVKITDVVLLSDFADYAGTDYYDVVDMRDFIVGSADGGLSVVTPRGEHARAPYALPYVSLRSRAKIPAEAEIEISRIIWQANVRFFAGSNITVSGGSLAFLRLVEDLGFDNQMLMEDFCQLHVDTLLESV